MTPNRALALILLPLILAITFVAYTKGASDQRAKTGPLAEQTITTCESTENFNSDTGAILRSAGWFAKADDGAERLYSPAC